MKPKVFSVIADEVGNKRRLPGKTLYRRDMT
jgi:hypothetical protein